MNCGCDYYDNYYCDGGRAGAFQYCTDSTSFGYPDGAFNYTNFISR